MLRLKDKVVVITGGSSGIGKALVAAALEHGAKVAVCARNLEKLGHLFIPSDNLFCFKADVSIEKDCGAFIAATIQRWGGIDVLITIRGAARFMADEAGKAGLSDSAAIFFDSSAEAGDFLRDYLRPGDAVVGPAVFEEAESTFVVGPGGRATVLADGTIDVVLP